MLSAKDALSSGYTLSAALYDGIASPLYLAGFRQVASLLRPPPAPAILDVGTGTGIALLEAHRLFGPCRAAYGVDLSPGMISLAAVKASALGIPAVFVLADAEQLPFANDAFDLVTCVACFHWFTDRRRALLEMKRVLKPGGQLALTVAVDPCFAQWFALLSAALAALAGPRAVPVLPNLPTAAEVAHLLGSTGFAVDVFQARSQVIPVTDPDAFIGLMTVEAPYWLSYLTPGELQAVWQRLKVILQNGGSGRFGCTWAGAVVVARKPALM